MTDSFAQVRKLMASMLLVAEDRITPDTVQGDLVSWDSVQHLNLMLALEQEFGVRLGVDDLQNLTSVSAILDRLGSECPLD